MKVLIVGGGVAGLATGWRLAEAGCTVEVVEAGRAGRGATWASAGMIGFVGEEAPPDKAHAQFARFSRGLWQDFAAELERAAGMAVGYRNDGALITAFDEVDAEHLRAQATALSAAGETVERLTEQEARHRAPLLSPAIAEAYFHPREAQVDNRALGPALARALVRAGGALRELERVEGILVKHHTVRGIRTAEGSRFADVVVIAAGAWCGQLPELALPVTPAKGQMVALATPAGRLPHPLLWSRDVYLVPRGERMLVGATMEDAGFDTAVTREHRDQLLRDAARLVPAIADWPVTESWAGLRPRTPDGDPILGPADVAGLFVATGQFRNGILFAPAIAETLKRFVRGERVDYPASGFPLARFAAAG